MSAITRSTRVPDAVRTAPEAGPAPSTSSPSPLPPAPRAAFAREVAASALNRTGGGDAQLAGARLRSTFDAVESLGEAVEGLARGLRLGRGMAVLLCTEPLAAMEAEQAVRGAMTGWLKIDLARRIEVLRASDDTDLGKRISPMVIERLRLNGTGAMKENDNEVFVVDLSACRDEETLSKLFAKLNANRSMALKHRVLLAIPRDSLIAFHTYSDLSSCARGYRVV